MAAGWSYGNDPESSNRDAVRLLTGDTESGATVTLSDAEVDYFLAVEADVNAAAARAARALAAQYAPLVDKAVGDLRISYSDAMAHFETLAATIDRRSVFTNAGPFTGGASVNDKRTRREDSDRTQGYFRRGRFDHPALGNLRTGSTST